MSETLLVRQRPTFDAEACYVARFGAGVVRIAGLGWHRVPAEIGDALRVVPTHDLPGHRHGEKHFAARFDALTEAEFVALVAKERARVEGEAERAARRAAEQAIASRIADAEIDALGNVAVTDATIHPLAAEQPKQGEKTQGPAPEPVDLAVPIATVEPPECAP